MTPTYGWTPAVAERLEQLVDAGAGKGLPVFFDFDNTILCRDIGEATFAQMLSQGTIHWTEAQKISPPMIQLEGMPPCRLETDGIVAYYYRLLEATSRYPNTASSDVGYGWLLQILHGLTVADVLHATQTAYQAGAAHKDMGTPHITTLDLTGGSVPVPYFYPQMVELLAKLLENDYEVHILSASNVWTVRWMVTQALNPMLRKIGRGRTIDPDHVVGLSTLLYETNGNLFRDSRLLELDTAYKSLEDPEALRRYFLSAILEQPLSAYEGKRMHMALRSKETPYLVAGDSQNDYPMLEMATHKLYMARLESPNLQACTQLRRDTSWIVQPVLTQAYSGVLQNPEKLPFEITDKIAASLQILGYS